MNQKGFIYAGNLLQTVNYYPSGVPFTLTDDDPVTDRLHTGKPFIDMQGLGYYDNNARFLDILTGSFISVDPLAGKYPSLTPYNHCANNPLIYVDPTGEVLTETAQVYADILREKSMELIVKELLSQNSNQTIINEMANTMKEMVILEKSTQIYDVKVGSKELPEIATGMTTFDMQTGHVVMQFKSFNPSMSIIAHEFKHSSQFDTGELSLSDGRTLNTPLLYDKIDEVEAYKRGSYFGGPKYSIDNLPQLYAALSDTQRNCFNVNELKLYVGINLSEKHVNQLKHRLRTPFQQAVRFNGTTYY